MRSDGRLHVSGHGTERSCAWADRVPAAPSLPPSRGLRSRTKRPEIALQVLHYAVLDLVTAPEQKADRGSRVPPRWMSEVFRTTYIRDPGQRRHYLASPAWGANADGIHGIAPALVITCGEGSTLARRGRGVCA